MATYLNKNMIDGVEELPRLTEEEFEEIPVAERPKIWVKRNATETDRGITASDVEYDNTSSGLTATDVQDTIDEIVVDINSLSSSVLSIKDDVQELELTIDNLSASTLDYDNTNSGLVADNVQGAIDEISDRVDELVTVEANPSETPTATMESLEVDGTIYKVGGGHAVKDSSGNTMTQRENLQFTDAHTSDDSQGNTTKVEIAKQVTSQEWEEATEQGFYLIGDDDDYLLDISQVSNADASHIPYSSSQSTKQKIDAVNSAIPTNTNQLTNGAGFITALALQAGSITTGHKILDTLTSANTPIGASLWFCQTADDSPDKGNVGAVLIIKATQQGLYSRLFAFVGGSIYSAQTGSLTPTSITWGKISTI